MRRRRVTSSGSPQRGHPLALLAVAALLAAAALGATPAAASPAHAGDRPWAPTPNSRVPDSLAPPGAGPNWLPDEPWVMEHWLPYRQSQLFRLLRTDREGVRRWLTRRPLAALAHARGLRVSRLASALLRGWRGRVSARHYALLRERTVRTFTQRHLLQHMLFHPFHVPEVSAALPALLGSTRTAMLAAQHAGVPFGRQAERNGVAPAAVAAGVWRIVRRVAARGVRLHDTPAAEAREWLSVQRHALPALLDGPSGPMPGMGM